MDAKNKVNDLKEIKLLKLEAEGAEPEILQGATEFYQSEICSADVGAERGLKYETTILETIKFLENNNS